MTRDASQPESDEATERKVNHQGNVVEIGDFSIERRRRYDRNRGQECFHHKLRLKEGEIVICRDCDRQVGAFWALELITDEYNRWTKKYDAAVAVHRKTVAKDLHLLAARDAEKAWRNKSMVPSCPHCLRGILPEDGFGGSLINRKIEMSRRESDRPRILHGPSQDGGEGREE